MGYNKEEVIKASTEYFNDDDLAIGVFADKYALRDKEEVFYELTPDAMHDRLAAEFARIETDYALKAFPAAALGKYGIREYFDKFKYIVPQGSPMAGIGNEFSLSSLSNCVVTPGPEDSITSIMERGKTLANLFKMRCGVGIDLSKPRPMGTLVNNAANTSIGAWSFSDFYSYITKMIGQEGRRGALIITMDIHHPDIEYFIKMKQDRTKVTGANVSIKITNDFIEALENDKPFMLQWPIDSPNPTITREVMARDLWKQIVDSATYSGDPGLFFWDKILENLPAHCYPGFETIATNPCGEVPLSANDSCRLISINLKNFVEKRFTKEAYFDFEKFKEVVRAAMRLSDDLVDLEIEKIKKIINKVDTLEEKELWQKLLKAAELGRRTGLGTHGLADCFINMCFRYDSDEALALADQIYETLKISAYAESVELAKQRGPFPVFNWELEKDNKFIKSLPEWLQDEISNWGRRNISILTNAPTGSVSIESQTSSGIEPVFRFFYKRRKKISDVNIKADFIDESGDRWIEYDVAHLSAQEWKDMHPDQELPDYFVHADQIDWSARVRLQGTIQKHIDHSISSTINLPRGTKPEVVDDIYRAAWEYGCKGVTVYVEGSKDGVLLSDDEVFEYHDAPKRPETLDCDIHHTSVKGKKWVVFVGLFRGKPYEVMGGEASMIELSKKYDNGQIQKHSFKTKASIYDLHLDDGNIIRDIIKVFDNSNFGIHTRHISTQLRHGVRPSFIVEQLAKDPDSDFHSFSKAIGRVLKKYIEDGTKVQSDKVCPQCDSESLIYQEGCVTCVSCGFSKCG